MDIAERLNNLRNRQTRYEVIAEIGATSYRLGYTTRKSKMTLLDLARRHGNRLITLSGSGDEIAAYTAAGGWVFGSGKLRVRLSGRTEREALTAGELPLPGVRF